MDELNSARRRARRRYWQRTVSAYLYLLPSLVVLGVFHFWPAIQSIGLSLYDWDLISPVKQFVGTGNYAAVLADGDFLGAIRNTALYSLLSVPVTMALALGIALLLNARLKLRGLFRSAYFIPYVTMTVAVAMIWRWLFNTDYGLVNALLDRLGIHGVPWLTSPPLAIPLLAMLSVWRFVGYYAVIYLAGLQGIDREFYEAAQIDGANRWQVFRYITWPLLSPTTLFVGVVSLIGSFKVFDAPFILWDGRPGPQQAATTLVFYVYQKAFREWHMGLASAAAYVMFAGIFLLTILQFRLSRTRVHYQ